MEKRESKNMKIENFQKMIQAEVQKAIGNRETVLLKTVQKVNVAMVGITIQKKDGVSPMIYLDEYYKDFENGRNTADIVQEIIQLLMKTTLSDMIIPTQLMDYEWVKPRLRVKVINRNRNQELLKDIPHETVLDLAIVTYLLLGTDQGEITSLVRNSMIEMWNVSEKDVINQAKENTENQAPCQINKMSDFIFDMMLESVSKNEDIENMEKAVQELLQNELQDSQEMELFILTNQSKMHGAYVIFYKQMLSQLANQLKVDGLYLLPSSVHEMLAVSSREANPDELRKMVQEVNQTTVSDTEYLSDSVYYYDCFADEIKIA
jgi:hypothetical protein